MIRTFATHIIILLTCTFNTLSAQTRYSIKNINTKNGLPQNSITGMAVGLDGYVWVGTQSGLVRYDGTNAKTFLFNNSSNSGRNDVRYIITTRKEKGFLLVQVMV